MKPPKKKIAPEVRFIYINKGVYSLPQLHVHYADLCFSQESVVRNDKVLCEYEECLAMYTLQHVIPCQSARPKRRGLNHSCSPQLLHTNIVSWTVNQL